MKNFAKSIAGGFMIGIGGTVYLSCDIKYIGALLFAIGLLTICEFGLGLYTGKVGYIVKEKGTYYREVLVTLLGNACGTLLCGLLISAAKPGFLTLSPMCDAKLASGIIPTLISSAFCGVLMFIAVRTYKKREGIGKYLGIFTAVPVFILSGFEHSIANMFYFSAARIFTLEALAFILICVIGNALGAFAIALFDAD